MRAANAVLDLPCDCRCHDLEDRGRHVEARASRDKGAQPCPRCRKGGAVIHGHAKRSACHVPARAKPRVLVIDLRYCRCKRCGRTFFEPPSAISEHCPHMTTGLEHRTASQARLGRSFAEAARGCGASADIVREAVGAAPLPKRHPPRHLRAHEIATAAGSVKGARKRVLSAYATGKTNACAENANRKIKGVKRRACGLASCEGMRRRLLLAYGYPPVGKGGVPLPDYGEQAARGDSPCSSGAVRLVWFFKAQHHFF